MKMTEGCNSLATAKSALTSFSPSPTCDEKTGKIKQRNDRVDMISTAEGKMLTYLEVKLAALMLKKVALDSAATALALCRERKFKLEHSLI